MSDIRDLRGPDGSPSDPDDLVGSSGSAPASADPAIPTVHGPLAMTSHEISAFIRDNNIEFLGGPTPETEHEAEIFAAIRRAKPGQKPGRQERRRERYFAIYRECLTKNERNIELADAEFVERAMTELNVKSRRRGTACPR